MIEWFRKVGLRLWQRRKNFGLTLVLAFLMLVMIENFAQMGTLFVGKRGDRAVPYWVIPIVALVVAGTIAFWKPPAAKTETTPLFSGSKIDSALYVLTFTILLLAYLQDIGVIDKYGDAIWDFLRRTVPPTLLQIGIVTCTGLFGVSLYWLRCRRLQLYGSLEILVGIMTAAYVANVMLGEAKGDISIWFAEAAALYVIVRGLDNAYKSLGEGPMRRRWNRVFFGQDSATRLG